VTKPMTEGRAADAARRRARVVKAISDAARDGEEITVSAIARRALVDRTYLYRHQELLAQIHALQSDSPDVQGHGPTVSRASLQTDLANAEARNARLLAHNRLLEKKLSELMGEQVWRESGLGAPADVEQLQRRVVNLEQQVVDLNGQLQERSDELAAARAANRELMGQLNSHRNRNT
jgi:chromosome segregation ATPase